MYRFAVLSWRHSGPAFSEKRSSEEKKPAHGLNSLNSIVVYLFFPFLKHFNKNSVCPTFQPVWLLLCTGFSLKNKYMNINIYTLALPDGEHTGLPHKCKYCPWVWTFIADRRAHRNAALWVILRLFSVILGLWLCGRKKRGGKAMGNASKAAWQKRVNTIELC